MGRELLYLELVGAPGAGEGTLAVLLTDRLGILHVLSGDLFRESLEKETEPGILAKSYRDRGELAPDNVTIAVVMDRLTWHDCERGAILDGFPHTLTLGLEKALAERGHRISAAPCVRVSEGTLLARQDGRWTCKQCKVVCYQRLNPPKVCGV